MIEPSARCRLQNYNKFFIHPNFFYMCIISVVIFIISVVIFIISVVIFIISVVILKVQIVTMSTSASF